MPWIMNDPREFSGVFLTIEYVCCFNYIFGFYYWNVHQKKTNNVKNNMKIFYNCIYLNYCTQNNNWNLCILTKSIIIHFIVSYPNSNGEKKTREKKNSGGKKSWKFFLFFSHVSFFCLWTFSILVSILLMVD